MSRTIDASPLVYEERTLRAEVKLYYDLYLPPEGQKTGGRPLLIALHGYGANKRQMMREARLVAPEDFVVASLQGFHQHLKEPREKGGPLRFGFGWLTNFHPEESIAMHHRALLDMVSDLTREGAVDTGRVFLMGFSQSCALNYRFAFTHTETLRGVVGVCGGLPGDWETSPLYKESTSAVLHLHGTHDEFYSPERVSDYETRLRMRAASVEVKAYDAGHEMTDAMRRDIHDWIHRLATV